MSQNETPEAEETWESMCASCGGSCPEFRRLADGSIVVRDPDQDPAVEIHLSKENLKALVGKWISWV